MSSRRSRDNSRISNLIEISIKAKFKPSHSRAFYERNEQKQPNPAEYDLDNGAMIMAMKHSRVDNSYVVLARTHDGEYVTWWAHDWRASKTLCCSSGHYFEDLEQAVEDFQDRN